MAQPRLLPASGKARERAELSTEIKIKKVSKRLLGTHPGRLANECLQEAHFDQIPLRFFPKCGSNRRCRERHRLRQHDGTSVEDAISEFREYTTFTVLLEKGLIEDAIDEGKRFLALKEDAFPSDDELLTDYRLQVGALAELNHAEIEEIRNHYLTNGFGSCPDVNQDGRAMIDNDPNSDDKM